MSGLLCGVHSDDGVGSGPRGLWDKDNQADSQEEENDNKSNKSPSLSSSLLSTVGQCMKYHIMFILILSNGKMHVTAKILNSVLSIS